MKNLDDSKTVLLATFSVWKNKKRTSLNGNVEPLIDFFTPKVKKTVLIDQPYPGSDILFPKIEIYQKEKKTVYTSSSFYIYVLYPFLKIVNYHATHLSFKLRDFLSVVDWCIRDKEKFDYFIGLEAVNAIAGILMRNLGRIKTVIYYVSDYSPNRYKVKIVNDLYVWLDRYCAMHADYIWDVSKAMQPARIQAGLDPKKSAPVLNVPNALYPVQIQQAKNSDIKQYSLVFMGTLGPENGPDIAVAALPFVISKFPKTVLHIVGGGEDNLDRLKALARKLKVEKEIIFHGFIADREQISKIIRTFSLALAPYVSIEGSPRFYGDATKIRAYLAASLPVITTHVPPLGKEAEKAGAAIVISDDPKEFAKVIEKVFSDKKLYIGMRKRAFEYAKENTWENEFKKGFEGMQKT